jgi:Fe-S cluster biosynthesis and repair protein YggX
MSQYGRQCAAASFHCAKAGATITTCSYVLSNCTREDEMTEVECVTCGQKGEAITDMLFLGKLESEVKAKVCKACWKKWEGMRVMVINEYQINLGDETGRDLVRNQMKAFLKLGETSDTSKLDQNYRPPS